MTYLQAISAALRDELRADERVLVMGEDIGVFGGAFKVTDGFVEEFGPDRVMDTPLAESAIIGSAVGAAVVGMRPVCEMQFADFISCGFDQLVNVAGKMHYRQGAGRADHRAAAVGRRLLRRAVPLAEPRGAGSCTRPGSRSSRPRPPRTPRGCCTRRSTTPTRSASWSTSTCTGGSRARCPRASSRRRSPRGWPASGSDLVVIAYGAMVHVALEATRDLDGASVEVLDLRSLVPLDEDAILDSVARCSKVVIVDEAN